MNYYTYLVNAEKAKDNLNKNEERLDAYIFLDATIRWYQCKKSSRMRTSWEDMCYSILDEIRAVGGRPLYIKILSQNYNLLNGINSAGKKFVMCELF